MSANQVIKIKKLKVKPKKAAAMGQCVPEMTALLNCWSSLSIEHPRCTASASTLAMCMSNAKPAPKVPNTLNYHLNRLGKNLLG